jgi:outer membrane murein-binding lipoprotein Lpp
MTRIITPAVLGLLLVAREIGGEGMRALSIALVSSLLLGCVAQDDPRLKKVEALASQVSTLEFQNKALEARVGWLEGTVNILQAQASAGAYETATFDPGEPRHYSRIDTTGGTFLVMLEDVTPYVDGFRVTFKFGNPSSATFNGFKIKAKWGSRFDFKAKGANWATWHASLREKEISVTDNLYAGSWNSVSFVVSPAKREEFGYLQLSTETDRVILRN